MGSAWGAGLFVGTASELHLARGDVRRARHLADTSIALLDGVGLVHALANVCDVRATIARLDGDEPLGRGGGPMGVRIVHEAPYRSQQA